MAKLAVVGLGKLGAPMAAIYSSLGHEVVGCDKHFETVRRVRNGESHIDEPGYQELLLKHPFEAIDLVNGSQSAIFDADAYFIVVPTPSDSDGRFTNEYVVDAIRHLEPALVRNEKEFDIVICSTVMPGSCDGPIRKAITDASGKRPGVECGLVYSPEFIALGSVVHDMLNPDMILLGASHRHAARRVLDIYKTVTDAPSITLGLKEAELAKIAINSYITMKISFANSISMLSDKHPGINSYRVCEAIGMDSRIGSKYIKPGGPYGGPCFPRDTVAFSTLFDLDAGAELSDATKWINDAQIDRAAAYVKAYLKLNHDPLQTPVCILGTSYKPGTHIAEESFGTRLGERLDEDGIVFDTAEEISKSTDAAKVVVVCTPDDKFKELRPARDQIVLDFWDIVPDVEGVVKMGKS